MPARTRSPRSLKRILAVRTMAVSVSVAVSLTVAVFFNYMLDTAELRRATLQADLRQVVQTLAAGKDPAALDRFRRYPNAYGLRVFSHRATYHRKLVTEANADLLPPLRPPPGDSGEFALSEGFGLQPRENDQSNDDRWMLTDHVDANGQSYWVQMAMVGDPAWRWTAVMAEEMRSDVLLPLAFIIPTLTLTMILTIGHALRPLDRMAMQAGALSRAVTSGAPFEPIGEDNAPAEIGAVIVALNTMMLNMRHSFRRQQQFASDAAHELRTPLAVLLLEAERLPPSESRDLIIRDMKALGGMVNQLLRFAQAEDVMARERRMLDLTAVARQVCEDIAALAVTRGQTIAFEAPAEPVAVTGHDALIDVAISNVLDNALKHSPVGASVTVIVGSDGTVCIDDQGPGVPDAQKDRIFERFWRASALGTGAGIGLALVRRVARLHGGDARVEDVPSGGARFILTFAPPRAASPARKLDFTVAST